MKVFIESNLSWLHAIYFTKSVNLNYLNLIHHKLKDKILDTYKVNKKTYHNFRERVINLLTDLLSVQEIVTHQISSRTKSIESLSKKIDGKGDKYKSIDDITDIIGIRIITYMDSDVDAIAKLIENEFIIDIENSIDKRKLKADQFGYRSLHLVASLNKSRCDLKEYKKYNGIKCEIQIRSILQHAWAEIEHDLGYKGEVAIPEQYKRTFNRLSALLETAGVEFDRLKNELEIYEKDVPALINTTPEIVDINQASILSFINTNTILLKARTIMESKIELKLGEAILLGGLLKKIKFFDFKTIGELEQSLITDSVTFLKFVELVSDELLKKGDILLTTTPLLWYLHYLISKANNTIEFEKYSEDKTYNSNIYNFYLSNYEKAISN
jgi:putative GTP pyrophosphokinase